MFGRKPRPTFYYGERVRVIQGFYTSQLGTVVLDSVYSGYHVKLDNIGGHPVLMDAHWLERLVPEEQPEHIRKIVLGGA